MYRKCKTCHFYGNEHWCYWLGKPRRGNQEECEDACEKGSKRDVLTMNDLIKKQKEQRKADARREKRKRK